MYIPVYIYIHAKENTNTVCNILLDTYIKFLTCVLRNTYIVLGFYENKIVTIKAYSMPLFNVLQRIMIYLSIFLPLCYCCKKMKYVYW